MKDVIEIKYIHFSPPTMRDGGPETREFEDSVEFDANNFISEVSEFIDLHIKSSLKLIFIPALSKQLSIPALESSLLKLIKNKCKVLADHVDDEVIDEQVHYITNNKSVDDIMSIDKASALLSELFTISSPSRLKNLGIEE